MVGAALVCLVLLSLPAAAQTVDHEVIPQNPTTSHEVILRFSDPGILEVNTVTRTGNHFAIDFRICLFTCIAAVDVPLGRLPAGDYTYAFSIAGFPRGTGSFAVAAQAPVPTLSESAMMAMSALLAGVALFAIGRRG